MESTPNGFAAGSGQPDRNKTGRGPGPESEDIVMASQLGPIEVQCDAPSYPVVRACRRVGIESPEDVRWCRMSQFLAQASRWKGLFHPWTWSKLLGRHDGDEKCCTCSEKLPALE